MSAITIADLYAEFERLHGRSRPIRTLAELRSEIQGHGLRYSDVDESFWGHIFEERLGPDDEPWAIGGPCSDPSATPPPQDAEGAFAPSDEDVERLVRSALEDGDASEWLHQEGLSELREVVSFEDSGVLTMNRGLVLRFAGGRQFQISIVRSR